MASLIVHEVAQIQAYHIYYRYFPEAYEVVVLSIWSSVRRGRPKLPR
jgi:hypothetical protein